jgi:hypothetical protein
MDLPNPPDPRDAAPEKPRSLSDADKLWALLRARIESVSATLPEDLGGVIQLDLDGRDGAVILNGARSTTIEGLWPEANAYISADRDAVASLARGKPASNGVRVGGEARLVLRFFQLIAAAPTSGSWLDMRSGR